MAEVTKYTSAQVATHNTFIHGNAAKSSLWVIYKGKVYDVTAFVSEHPGGEEVLIDNAGKDITSAFTEIGHGEHALKLLAKYQIGELDGASAAPTQRKRPATVTIHPPSSSGGISPALIAIIVLIAAVVGYYIVSQ